VGSGYLPVDNPPGTKPLPLGTAAPAPVGRSSGGAQGKRQSAPPAKRKASKRGSRPMRTPKGNR